MFQQTQDVDYLELVENRVQENYLTWCEQFLDLITEYATDTQCLTLNEVGCCAGQFYKSLKRRGLPIDYRGFDIEPAYLAIARRVFPELADAVQIRDIEKELLPLSDITVVSATLEHLDEPAAAVEHILQSTQKFALFRTFLGESALDQWRHKSNASKPYRIRQFEREAFLANLQDHGFRVVLVEDRYTLSRPVEIDTDIVRAHYIVVANRL